jgi:hypothetical protein
MLVHGNGQNAPLPARFPRSIFILARNKEAFVQLDNAQPGMKATTKLYTIATIALMLAAGNTAASAQEHQASPIAQATPAPESTPTLLDRQYDGQTHVTVAPYIWGPTVGGSFQYSIPTLPRRPRQIIESSVSIGPADYLPKLNSAAMVYADVRKGDFDLFADGIYVNASMTSSQSATFAGPLGKIQIPVTLSTNAHLSTAIWEVAGGYSVAHGHNADLSLFGGLREFPTNLTLDYNVLVVGKRGVLAPSGTVDASDYISDLIVGMRGRAFFGGGRIFVPYYADYGQSVNTVPNQTWEAYSGFGYAFEHGQTLVALYRALNFNSFQPTDHVQRLEMYGPLLGYTFGL